MKGIQITTSGTTAAGESPRMLSEEMASAATAPSSTWYHHGVTRRLARCVASASRESSTACASAAVGASVARPSGSRRPESFSMKETLEVTSRAVKRVGFARRSGAAAPSCLGRSGRGEVPAAVAGQAVAR